MFEEGSKGEIAMRYFQKLFTSSNPWDASVLLEGLAPRVTPAMNRELIKTITADEIKKADFSIKGSAAPYADGMNGVFFQTYWSVVGGKVVKDVKRFFEEDFFPKGVKFDSAGFTLKRTNSDKND